MGNFYIDDSVHEEAGFIICACVYCQEDVDEEISQAIINSGFDPNDFEFKSSANYSKEPDKAKVRSLLKDLIQKKCKYGIVVLPKDERKSVGIECLNAVSQFINSNTELKIPLSIFIDQGMFESTDKANTHIANLGMTNAKIHIEQDSKVVRGIQLADLIAHMTSIQLKSSMGIIKKTVKAGDNSGYDPKMEIELSFEMFATLRYNIFSKAREISGDMVKDLTCDVGEKGLYVSEKCSDELKDVAHATFGTVYLGCIH